MLSYGFEVGLVVVNLFSVFICILVLCDGRGIGNALALVGSIVRLEMNYLISNCSE